MSILWWLISWLIVGLAAGGAARKIIPGEQPMSLPATLALGVGGSYAGGLLSWLVFGGEGGPIRPAGIIMSILGAVLVLLGLIYYGKVQTIRDDSPDEPPRG